MVVFLFFIIRQGSLCISHCPRRCYVTLFEKCRYRLIYYITIYLLTVTLTVLLVVNIIFIIDIVVVAVVNNLM